ncbi:hypothetical protein BGZ94_001006, partial [Podila epigama]
MQQGTGADDSSSSILAQMAADDDFDNDDFDAIEASHRLRTNTELEDAVFYRPRNVDPDSPEYTSQ